MAHTTAPSGTASRASSTSAPASCATTRATTGSTITPPS